MKKIILLLVTILFCNIGAIAQNIAINNDGSQPNASAILDIKNANKGLLIPRVSLISETDAATIPSPVLSLLVFNTNAALPEGAGFYFWNGNSKWSRLATLSALNNTSWGLSGNSAINPNNDFIGTTDNQPLIFKTNNILSGKIAQGINSVFFGQHAGENVTTGTNNTFMGDVAGSNNTSGSGNLFAGRLAGFTNTTGNDNVFLGKGAGQFNTTGPSNIAIGSLALNSNTSGSLNFAAGAGALFSNTTGANNLAFGYAALNSNTTGNRNTATGYQALYSNITGSDNIANGYQALTSNTTGYYNIANGYQALYSNTTGSHNIANGYQALYSNTTSDKNVAIGYRALYSHAISYSDNVAIGAEALYSANTTSNNTAIGVKAMYSVTSGSYNVAVGSYSGPTISNAYNTTALGYYAQVSSDKTMAFGSSGVEKWAFGRTTTIPATALQVGTTNLNGNGAFLTVGGSWTNASSRTKKEDFLDLNGDDLLHKISQLSIQKWKYKGTEEYHIGPVAEDFFTLFGLGVNDQGISTVDPSGIALAGMKELMLINEKQDKLIEQLQKKIEMLEKK